MYNAFKMLFFHNNREKDRKVGPDGFLDSSRLRHSHSSRREKKEQKEEKPTYTSVIELTSRKERDKRDYEKRIKVIEVCYSFYVTVTGMKDPKIHN